MLLAMRIQSLNSAKPSIPYVTIYNFAEEILTQGVQQKQNMKTVR